MTALEEAYQVALEELLWRMQRGDTPRACLERIGAEMSARPEWSDVMQALVGAWLDMRHERRVKMRKAA